MIRYIHLDFLVFSPPFTLLFLCMCAYKNLRKINDKFNISLKNARYSDILLALDITMFLDNYF